MSPSAIAPRPPLATVTLWLVRVLSLLAVGLAGWLSYSAITGGKSLGCTAGTLLDCDTVLASSWATVKGVPVAYIGAGVYVAIFLVSWLAGLRGPRVARWGVALLTMLSVAAAGAGLWFIGVQAVQLGTFCPRCLGVHVCGLLIGLLVLVSLLISAYRARFDAHSVSHLSSALAIRSEGKSQPIATAAVTGFGQLIAPVALGLIGIGGLIATQHFLPDATHEIAQAGQLDGDFDMTKEAVEGAHVVRRPTGDTPLADAAFRATEEAKAREAAAAPVDDSTFDDDADVEIQASDDDVKLTGSRVVQMYKDQLKFDIYQEAYLGSPEAEYVVLELFDYTCPHCRKVQRAVRRARRRYGKQLAIVTMPVPLELRCNKMLREARPKNRGACKLARLALATADLNPAAFGRLHYWLMADPDRTRPYDQALVRAYDDVGRSQLRNILNSEEFEARIQRHINLFANLSQRWEGEKMPGLPLFVAGDKTLSGRLEFDDEFFEFLEDATGIEPVRKSSF